MLKTNAACLQIHTQSVEWLYIFIACEPGLSYCALLPPDATNFESEYPITIFMHIFIMYF